MTLRPADTEDRADEGGEGEPGLEEIGLGGDGALEGDVGGILAALGMVD